MDNEETAWNQVPVEMRQKLKAKMKKIWNSPRIASAVEQALWDYDLLGNIWVRN